VRTIGSTPGWSTKIRGIDFSSEGLAKFKGDPEPKV